MASLDSLRQDPSTLQSFGRALGGFGAGFRGAGGQFLQGLDAQDRARDLEVKRARAQDLVGIRGALQRGDVSSAANIVQQRLDVGQQLGMDMGNTMRMQEAILMSQTPQDLSNVIGELDDDLLSLVNQGVISGEGLGLTTSGGLASAKTEILSNGTVIQSLPTGQVDVRDNQGRLLTGEARSNAISDSQELELTKKQKEAEIAVSKAQGVAEAGLRAKRVSEIRQEQSTRRRSAARSRVQLAKASKLAERAAQGLTGAGKLQAAKLFPGIDVSDEAQLDQALKQIALDQLQSFKGPTTDFEFGVTEDISGSIRDPKAANVARINALKRAGWFAEQEANQFDEFVDSGGNPDRFSFNFGAPVKTKKGVFTLQDLQDTAVANNLGIEDVLERLNR